MKIFGKTTVPVCCNIAVTFPLGTQSSLQSVSFEFEKWLNSGNWVGDHVLFFIIIRGDLIPCLSILALFQLYIKHHTCWVPHLACLYDHVLFTVAVRLYSLGPLSCHFDL